MKFTGRFSSPKNKSEKEKIENRIRGLLRNCASEGMVLLKNENLLPLKKKRLIQLLSLDPMLNLVKLLEEEVQALNHIIKSTL